MLATKAHLSLRAPVIDSQIIRRQFHQRRWKSRNGDEGAGKKGIEMERDFLLSVLEAQPTSRDSRSYLKAFSPSHGPPDSSKSRSQVRRDSNERALHERPHFPISQPMPTTAFPRLSSSYLSRLTRGSSALNPNGETNLLTTVEEATQKDLYTSLPNSATTHVGVVKLQGPFSDRQLASIAEGLVFLEKLGLASIVVIDNEGWRATDLGPGGPYDDARPNLNDEDRKRVRERIIERRKSIARETMRFADILEEQGGSGRPFMEGVLRFGPSKTDESSFGFEPFSSRCEDFKEGESANTFPPDSEDLFLESPDAIHVAIASGEMPIIPPFAFQPSPALRSVCIPSDDAVFSIVKGLVREAKSMRAVAATLSHHNDQNHQVPFETQLAGLGTDLEPMRVMIINREGGIPSHARSGDPHLSINLSTEYDYIASTFVWESSHPTSLSNLALTKRCLSLMARDSSAVIVSHRSPKSLIANLITNKPAHSPSLDHALLSMRGRELSHTPTVVRKGLPIRVIRDMKDLDRKKMTGLLEGSFGRTLDEEGYYSRLEKHLDFAIVAGDYQGTAIVTNEWDPADKQEEGKGRPTPIAYLDKFAVLPSLQGDGTVDFLWGALRDESFGLGLLDALNPNVGGMGGRGEGRDLVWRSRSNNPVNKWYFERSTGCMKIGEVPQSPGSSQVATKPAGEGDEAETKPKKRPVGFTMFWCDAEDKADQIRRALGKCKSEEEDDDNGGNGTSPWRAEQGRLVRWQKIVGAIPGCWVK